MCVCIYIYYYIIVYCIILSYIILYYIVLYNLILDYIILYSAMGILWDFGGSWGSQAWVLMGWEVRF